MAYAVTSFSSLNDIDLRQRGSCIGCSIQPGQRTYYFKCLHFWSFIGLFVTIIHSMAWLFHNLFYFPVFGFRMNNNYYGRWIL